MDSAVWILKIMLFLIGLCSGGVIAAGLFSFIVSIGAMNRIIGKTHTEAQIRLYENCIVVGIGAANFVSLYSVPLGKWIPSEVGIFLLLVFGISAGIFVGTLLMSLAETLNAIPVFSRNLHMMEGMKYLILTFAVGKGIGAWLDFWIKMKP